MVSLTCVKNGFFGIVFLVVFFVCVVFFVFWFLFCFLVFGGFVCLFVFWKFTCFLNKYLKWINKNKLALNLHVWFMEVLEKNFEQKETK